MEIKKKFVIGSRESALAVVQSRMVLAYLKEHCPELEPELLTMKTTGDKILDRRLDQIGGKGLFVKELDRALGEKRSDLSVHSLKDLPMEVPEELPVVYYSKREDPGMSWCCRRAGKHRICHFPSGPLLCGEYCSFRKSIRGHGLRA